MIGSVHPFPARMAPELALRSLKTLTTKSHVLDPMVGSGTVIRQAIELGHRAVGFDMDPLAVLMSRVWTTQVSDSDLQDLFRFVVERSLKLDPLTVTLPWIDNDVETSEFIDYWFGSEQKKDLRSIAFILDSLKYASNSLGMAAALDVLRVSLSRIIITKEQCASLARDTSHSRPHRVARSSGYSVFDGFEKSVNFLMARLRTTPPSGYSEVGLGDARRLPLLDKSVDMVLTSPPYLNAIDYMRGHRLALVWLGYRISELRRVRSNCIGAERGLRGDDSLDLSFRGCIGDLDALPRRYQAMIERYIRDVREMTSEVARVLRPKGSATFVVGNSCLKGVFVKNADLVAMAAETAGLTISERFDRELPEQRRYLPVNTRSSLGNRMRTETILTFKSI